MMAFKGMLTSAAENAGMKTPTDPDHIEYDPIEYPHFHVFCIIQLGRPMQPGEHWTNAEILAKVPDDKIMTLMFTDILALEGFQYSQ